MDAGSQAQAAGAPVRGAVALSLKSSGWGRFRGGAPSTRGSSRRARAPGAGVRWVTLLRVCVRACVRALSCALLSQHPSPVWACLRPRACCLSCFQLHQEYGEALTAPREHAGADRPSLKRLALPSERAHSLLSAQRLLSPPCARLLSSRSDSWSKTTSSTTCSQGPRPTWCVLRGCRRRVRVCRECVARVGARRGWTDALVSVGRASNSRKATSSSRCQTPCMSSPCPCAPCWARVALART
jgi:hypothetical protein